MHLVDLARAEQEQVTAGQAVACGKACDDGCHGPLTCVRAEHPHDPDAEMGVDENGLPLGKGNVTVHLGYTADGQLTQWTCLPGDHDGLTDDERSAKRAADAAEARAAATKALVDSIDPQMLVAMLRDRGHLS